MSRRTRRISRRNIYPKSARSTIIRGIAGRSSVPRKKSVSRGTLVRDTRTLPVEPQVITSGSAKRKKQYVAGVYTNIRDASATCVRKKQEKKQMMRQIAARQGGNLKSWRKERRIRRNKVRTC